MSETKSAKLLVEVQWGVIPGTVEGSRKWGWSHGEVEGAFEEPEDLQPGEIGAWSMLLSEPYAEMDRRMSPAHNNWVTLTWLWL